MVEEPPNYISFLMRLWKSDRNGIPIWRASLESTVDGSHLHFPTLEALIDFLKTLSSPPTDQLTNQELGSNKG